MVIRFSPGALALAALLCAISAATAQQLPAVSAVNGKFEFDAGALSLPSPAFMGRAAGTLTVPLGDRFGLQLDASIASSPGFTSSAALHGFTRDPQSYLVGGTLGIIRTPGATVVALGPEAELYFDRWTLEAWAGLSYARPAAGPARIAPLVMANLGYYLDDNTRLTVGLSEFDDYGTLQLGGEHLLQEFDLPLSVTGETRIGQDGAWRVTFGLRGYLAPENKPLIRRHREDDPADRSAALYTAAGGDTMGAPARPGGARSADAPGADPASGSGDAAETGDSHDTDTDETPSSPENGGDGTTAPGGGPGAGSDGTTAPGGTPGDGDGSGPSGPQSGGT